MRDFADKNRHGGRTYGADLDLAIDNDGLVLDGMKTQDGCRKTSVSARSVERVTRANIPVWGKLMIGVPIREPKTPPCSS